MNECGGEGEWRGPVSCGFGIGFVLVPPTTIFFQLSNWLIKLVGPEKKQELMCFWLGGLYLRSLQHFSRCGPSL